MTVAAGGTVGQRHVVFRMPAPGEIGITTASRATLLDEMEARLRAHNGFAVATLNLDHIVKLGRDPAFRTAYAQQTHVVADGNPIVWLCRLAGRRVDLVPGSDLIGPVMAVAARLGVPVGFIGSTSTVLDLASARLEAAHPGLRVVAKIAPPMGFDPEGADAEAVLTQMAGSGVRLVLLALGAPKQERLAALGRVRLPELGFLSIGAGLDFLAGAQKRAPVWVRMVAMEWFWRMMSDPARLAGRYAACAGTLPKLVRAAWAERRGV
ncbi:WecB/TagA/CpsF family glycosyltransferase [Fuscovulum ytuae]|uniref:WecB/TagA/CpsF family glycosyltransferase n=1 Tax=Fuscovulum ytuae TaxID=3042299 RepID=A0ABY8Q514_9RHOB|nr:WecB/TagA/CpsF family glycosyltransferase [Fuscovulum sp. YMD61]WGV15939.1 WecB/TagA/CpsF family glycosyltransferase [Fuscovulum sp. YMD61]